MSTVGASSKNFRKMSLGITISSHLNESKFRLIISTAVHAFINPKSKTPNPVTKCYLPKTALVAPVCINAQKITVYYNCMMYLKS